MDYSNGGSEVRGSRKVYSSKGMGITVIMYYNTSAAARSKAVRASFFLLVTTNLCACG